ncbi:hypothetical protein ACRALDRAFT_205971 [Sodiomyces alcalophilus JCM 7366]|uniref:uncharacterized protein n=1 Tax=Sodiomyces alcalophilus JCM 7366 TaxID=591952 RepID=UPI0039B4B4CC
MRLAKWGFRQVLTRWLTATGAVGWGTRREAPITKHPLTQALTRAVSGNSVVPRSGAGRDDWMAATRGENDCVERATRLMAAARNSTALVDSNGYVFVGRCLKVEIFHPEAPPSSQLVTPSSLLVSSDHSPPCTPTRQTTDGPFWSTCIDATQHTIVAAGREGLQQPTSHAVLVHTTYNVLADRTITWNDQSNQTIDVSPHRLFLVHRSSLHQENPPTPRAPAESLALILSSLQQHPTTSDPPHFHHCGVPRAAITRFAPRRNGLQLNHPSDLHIPLADPTRISPLASRPLCGFVDTPRRTFEHHHSFSRLAAGVCRRSKAASLSSFLIHFPPRHPTQRPSLDRNLTETILSLISASCFYYLHVCARHNIHTPHFACREPRRTHRQTG